MASIGANANMTPIDIEVIIGVITFIVSVATSAFIGGIKWGRVQSDVDHMKTDLAEIKGMFSLKLKE